MDLKNRILKIALLLFGLFCLIFVYRLYLIWKLPYQTMRLSSQGFEEKMEIPPRPGIQGIVITGPRIEPLYFSIDLSKPGIQPLDWKKLMMVDSHADVKIQCQVNEHGRLIFSQKDVLMEGHTEAGMMIQRAMKTWIFKPYKKGPMRFWFNLPSKGEKLSIDVRRLEIRESIPKEIPVYNGKLHLVDGIAPQDIRIGGQI